MKSLQAIQNCFVFLKTHMFKLVVGLIFLVFMQYMFDFMVITHRFLHPYTHIAQYNWTPFWKSGFNHLSFESLYNKRNFYLISRQAYSLAIKNTSKIMPSVPSPINPKFCPLNPPNLVGPLKVITDVWDWNSLEKIIPNLEPGGCFKPKTCKSRRKIAIIVPYRDRDIHLRILLHNLHPILQRQQSEYCIYVIEQIPGSKFNRAKLLNIGFHEAHQQGFKCFIFHDVDLIPEDDRNIYTCSGQPRHMSVAVSTLNYKLPYKNIFGGVSALNYNQMVELNGFSNKFWGWGGEDDDMANRIKFHGFRINRYPANISRYTMLTHDKQEPNPSRYSQLFRGRLRFRVDGLSNLNYKKESVDYKYLYTRILIDPLPSVSALQLSNI